MSNRIQTILNNHYDQANADSANFTGVDKKLFNNTRNVLTHVLNETKNMNEDQIKEFLMKSINFAEQIIEDYENNENIDPILVLIEKNEHTVFTHIYEEFTTV